jgi:hypothetical protein
VAEERHPPSPEVTQFFMAMCSDMEHAIRETGGTWIVRRVKDGQWIIQTRDFASAFHGTSLAEALSGLLRQLQEDGLLP